MNHLASKVFRRIGIVLAFVILATLATPADAIVDPEGPPVTEPPVADALVQEPSGPRPEARAVPDRPDSPELYEALDLIQDDLARNDEPVGLVRVSDSFDRVEVPLVGLTGRERQAVATRLEAAIHDVAPNIRVQVTNGKVTREELESLNQEVTERMRGKSMVGWGVGINVDRQAVEVTLRPEDYAEPGDDQTKPGRRVGQLRAEFADAHSMRDLKNRGLTVDDVVVVDQAVSSTVDTRLQLPLDVGNWMNVDLGPCTAGFLMRRNNGDLRGTSAGHCSTNGVGKNVWTAGHFVGTTVAQTYVNGTRSDAVAFTVPGHTGWNCIQTSPAGGCWFVTAEIVQSQMNVWVCHAGRGLWANEGQEISCGSIKTIDLTITDIQGIEHRNLDCSEDRTYPGDSGGPVWNWGNANGQWAAGNVSLSRTTGALWWEKHYTCYHVMSDIRAALGYSLVTH